MAMPMASYPFSNSPYPSPSRNNQTYPSHHRNKGYHETNGYPTNYTTASNSLPGPLPSPSVSVHGGGIVGISRTPSEASLNSLPSRQEHYLSHTSHYRAPKTPPTSNGNIHYRRHVRNMTMGIPGQRSGYDTSGSHRSYSHNNSTDPSFYTPSPSPAMRITLSRPGPAVRRNYQRASSWSQIPPDGIRRVREQYPQGNSLDLQLYSGLPNGSSPRDSSQRHSSHRSTMYEQVNGRSRTHSMGSMRSMRSNESQDSSIGYSQPLYYPQNSMNSLHYQNRQHGGSQSRSHVDFYEDNYQDDMLSVRSSRRSSVRSRPASSPLPLQRGQLMPQHGNMNQGTPHQQYPIPNGGERQKRVSRRSSYSKLLGIPSEEEKKVEGEGFKVAHESFRNSTYGWDLPGMRLSMLNLCPEGAETQAASLGKDGQDERRKLNDTHYTTTLESTTRPYTPDKFLTARGHLKDLQPNKMVKSTSTGGTTTRSSKWKFGRRSPGSLKAEENDLDLDLVPTLTNEKEEPVRVQKEGKKLLKKFRSKTPRPSLDLDGTGKAVFVSKRKGLNSFEGFFGRKNGGWREQDGTADIDTELEMALVEPYTATTKAGPTTGLIKTAKGLLADSKDVTIPTNAEPRVNVAPELLLSPADKLAAYIRGKFSALRKWRARIISVKPKDIPTIVAAEVVISGHKRIPSRTSTPVQRTIKGKQVSALTPADTIEELQLPSPNASLANLKKKMVALRTREGWRRWEDKVEGKMAEKATRESSDSDLAAVTRTWSAHTVASSFNLKVVPERIGADSPSGFEVVGGKGAGRAWGVEAPVAPAAPGIGLAITTGSSEIVEASECLIPGRHSLDAGQIGGEPHEEPPRKEKEGKWNWPGRRTAPNGNSKTEQLDNQKLRPCISAGE